MTNSWDRFIKQKEYEALGESLFTLQCGCLFEWYRA